MNYFPAADLALSELNQVQCWKDGNVGHLCFVSGGFKVKIQGSKDDVNFRECSQENNELSKQKCETVFGNVMLKKGEIM